MSSLLKSRVKISINVEKQILDKASKKIDSLKERLKDRLAEATPVDTGNARDGWKVVGDKIINDVDYIDRLNEGTSKQAPAHFIEQTILSDPSFKLNGM